MTQRDEDQIERMSRMLCVADGKDPDQPNWVDYRGMASIICRQDDASKALIEGGEAYVSDSEGNVRRSYSFD